MLIEMLRPGGTDLARRWVAALMLAPESDRPAIVAEVERRLVTMYADPLIERLEPDNADADADISPVVHVVSPPVQKPGYVEQIERAYPADAPVKARARKRSSGDARSVG